MKNLEWIVEERDVPALGRRVNTGDVLENVPDDLALQFVEQGVAKGIEVPAESSAAESPGEGGGVSLPVLITKKMRRDLKERGYSDDQIDAMTPQQATDALGGATTT